MLLSLLAALSVAAAPSTWSCPDAYYGDGTCDCGCTAMDSDCSSANFSACERSGCTGGQVPWEHQNNSCMASACGDGWKANGEACDDGNALASGGCSAACSAVNAGYECGTGAKGCKLSPATPDAGSPDAGGGGSDAGHVDGGATGGTGPGGGDDDGAHATDGEGGSSSGCSSVPAGLALASLLLPFWARASSRRRRS